MPTAEAQTVVVTLPDTLPVRLEGEWARWARAAPHPHFGTISTDIDYRDVFVTQEVVMPDEPTTRRTGALGNREAGKRGYVYILINPAFAGFLKIGKTSKDPAVRARELSAGTGVPAPYAVAWDVLVSDCDHVERLIHHQLAPARARRDREFFAVPLKRAIAVARDIAAPFACACEESLPPIIHNAAEATMLPDASTVEVPSTRRRRPPSTRPGALRTRHVGVRGSWRSTPISVALSRKGFWASDQQSRRPLTPYLSSSLMAPMGRERFSALTPQLSQVLLAPLTLEIPHMRDLPIPAAQIRDISDKKYKMGGLFRVERAQDSPPWNSRLSWHEDHVAPRELLRLGTS